MSAGAVRSSALKKSQKSPSKRPGKQSREERKDNLLPIVLVLIVLCGASAFVHLSQRVELMEAGYQLSGYRQQISEIEEENNKLNSEIAELSAPGRLEEIAREKLGMVVPASVIHIETGNILSASLPSRTESITE